MRKNRTEVLAITGRMSSDNWEREAFTQSIVNQTFSTEDVVSSSDMACWHTKLGLVYKPNISLTNPHLLFSTIMHIKTLLIFAALAAVDVYGSHSHYHGPIAIPHVLHNGYLADTHEVAAAKSAHLAALATESHGHGYGGGYAVPHVLHDGHIADTHEVAAAKAEHFAAVAKAKAHAGYGHDYSGRYAGGYGGHSGAYQGYSHHVAAYHGPFAKPVVLKSGYLADTHEVAAAKHHHLVVLHKANYYGHHDYHY
ncbi:hypothetical protein J6590_088689 [Homalodisca vitripennis]|nr:hypothetical protein J6590_088689 [Homalodisca vitripennis]